VGIALIIALGVALSGGLGSATPWRTKQLDESYTILNMFDLKMTLTPGSYLEADELAQPIAALPHSDWINDIDWRLSLPTSVDASLRQAQNAATPEQSVLVSGRVIGVDVSNGGPVVNKLHVTAGRALEPGDAGEPVCLVEHNFAEFYDLEPGDRSIQLSGGFTLEPVGNGISAEHFMVMEEGSGVLGIMAQGRFAALFVPLETAQEIADLPGMVNEGLMTVVAGVGEADLDILKAEMEDALGQVFPQVGLDLEKVSENPLYRMLYDDIPGDQQMYDTFSFILLLGAAFGAFILIGRIVDAQRREIGINLALGVPALHIARRYLLIGAQIAFLGMALGVGLGLLLNQPMGNMIGELLPTPYFEPTFQPQVFLRGALIGMIIPFLAIIYPVWRAVRVQPVDAIQTGYLVSKGGGLAPLMAQLPLGRLPGSSFTQLPLRNLSRGPRRTLMTVLGLAMAIVVMIAIIGMIDTVNETMDTGAREIKQDAPDRTLVLLDDLYPLSGSPVTDVLENDKVAQAVSGIYLPGQLIGDETFEVFVQLMDLDNDLWSPTVAKGDRHSSGEMPGILITEKAARDLGVNVGDGVTLRHPYRESQRAWRLASTSVQVVGIHPDVLRTVVFMDIEDASVMNLEGVVNTLHLNPAPGVGIDDLRQDLSPVKGMVAVRRASVVAEALSDFLDDFMGVFVVIELVVLVMTLLIAFNTTRSNIDERRRELATMFAFGTPVRTVLRMAMVENLIVGVLGTAVGIGLGWLVLNTLLMGRFDEMMPELSPVVTLAPFTLGLAVLFGVLVVMVTPLLMARRLVRMDIPSTLRVIE
jgi:putative ABC transport system permease protein